MIKHVIQGEEERDAILFKIIMHLWVQNLIMYTHTAQ